MALARPGRDPLHEPLREVRRGLLRLHKALIDAERADFEAEHGPMNNAQFLTALMEEPVFQWLRPYSGLIVEIDEALATRDRPVSREDARAFVERVSTLVSPSMAVFAAARLDEVRNRHAGVAFIHAELLRAVSSALLTYSGEG